MLYCCTHEPLLNIELDHVILDELHLLLRIVGVLLGNLLEEVINGTLNKWLMARVRRPD